MSHSQSNDLREETGVASLLERLPALSRRGLLKMVAGASALTVTSGLLAACGGDDDDDDDDDGGDSGGGAADPTATEAAMDDEATPTEEDEPEPTEAGDAEVCEGGTLIYALSSDPPNMDPHVATGSAAQNVKFQLYTGLARYWEGGEIQPDLAESWEIADDGLTYTFALREGVLFHDGSPFTSADVKASYERIKDDATGANNQKKFEPVDTIDAPDDLTIVLNMAEPSAPLMSYIAEGPSAILSKAFLDGGGDPDLESVGTGPFKLESREPGVSIVVVKNEDYYWEGLPYLDKIEFIPFADENTRMAAAMGGDVTLAEYVPWKDYAAIRDDSGLTLHPGDAAAFMTVIYNVREAPFDDPKVRHALSYAFDRESIIEIVFFGEGSPMTGALIPPGLWGHNADLEGTFSYDPDRAKELLAEAGYADPADLGPVKLLSTSQYLMHQDTASIVQQNLRDIGMDVELELYDWPTVVERHNKSEYQFRIHGLGTGGADPDVLTNFFHSEGTFSKSNGFQDADIDAWLDEARTLTDQEERKKLYDQAQARIIELAPFNFLSYRVQAEVTSADVTGYVHLPGGLGFSSAVTLQQAQICE